MMTHHVVHESFKNNISNNTHNIAQRGPSCFQGRQVPPLAPPKCNPAYGIIIANTLAYLFTVGKAGPEYFSFPAVKVS